MAGHTLRRPIQAGAGIAHAMNGDLTAAAEQLALVTQLPPDLRISCPHGGLPPATPYRRHPRNRFSDHLARGRSSPEPRRSIFSHRQDILYTKGDKSRLGSADRKRGGDITLSDWEEPYPQTALLNPMIHASRN